MKYATKPMAMIILAVMLSACGEKTMDVEYYIAHKEARQQKLAECRNNPGEKAGTPNCKNADAAELKSMFRSKEMPKNW